MSFEIKECGKNIGLSIVENCTSGFFKGLVEIIEDRAKKKSERNNALEGVKSESIKEEVDIVIDKYCNELKEATACYSEDELKNMFEKYYRKYLYGQGFSDDDKEEVFKRYKIFVEKYIKTLSNKISCGEKIIIQKENEIIETVNDVHKNMVTTEYIKRIDQKQSEVLNKLCEDSNIPLVDICCNYAKVSKFDSKFVFLGNVFMFDKSESDERYDTYILSVQVKNIGKTPINEISISNVEVLFCKEAYDDNPERGYYVLRSVKHENTEKCTINIMPNSEQKLHLVVKRREDELNGGIDVEAFINGDESGQPPFAKDRLSVEFDMELVGKNETKEYHFYLLLSRSNDISYKDISGMYGIDYVGLEVKKGRE